MTDDTAPLTADARHGGPPISLPDRLGQSLWEAAPDAILVIDPHGRIVHANAQTGRMFGYQTDELLRHRVERLLPAYLRLTDEAASPGQPIATHLELTGLRSNGSQFPVELGLGPLPTEDGVLVTVIIRDVTRRKQADVHARQLMEEQAARAAAASAQDRIAFLTEITNLLASSLDYESTLQRVAKLVVPYLADWCAVHTREQGTIRRVALAHAAPEKIALLEKIEHLGGLTLSSDYPHPVARVFRTGRSEFVRVVTDDLLREVLRDEQHLELLRSVAPHSVLFVPLASRGRVVGVISFAFDTPERSSPDQLTLAEDLARRAAMAIDNARLYLEAQQELSERRQAEAALRASEERYRRLVETSPDAIVLTGLDSTVQMVNQQAVVLHGYERADEMIGLNAFDLIAPHDWERARADFQSTLENGSVSHRQYTLLKRDGTSFPAEVSGALIRDAAGQPSAILTVDRDITERVSAYQTLERRVEERTREIERRRHVAEAVRDLLDILNSTHSLAEILDTIAAQASRLLSADAVVIYQLQARDGLLRVQAAWGLDADLVENLDVSIGIGAVGQAVVARQPVAVSDTSTILGPLGTLQTTSERRARWKRELTQFHSLLAVPLIVKGEVYGGLVLYYRQAREFAGEDTALAATFGDHAALAIENARLFAQIEQQMQAQEALYRADDVLYRSLHVDRVLQALVDVVIDILGADKSSVYVWDEQREQLAIRTARGFKPETITHMVFAPGEGVPGQVLISGEPIAIEDTATDGRMARWVKDPEAIRSVISVPIRIGDQIFGVFGVNYCRPRTFTADDIRLFTALAQRAAMAIENARLYERALQAATLEERQRLARELHDSVSQSLYSLTLLAEAARRLAVAGDVQQAQQSLALLGETAQQALKEMRLLVYELRPHALEQVGLIGAVQQRLDAVERRGGVQTSLRVEGTLVLPAPVEDGLHGIIQEALNNALKHAAATVVTVAIQVAHEQVDVCVRDNGVGFDPEAMRGQGGIGLVSMRERAERLGASLVLDSAPGAGTAVSVSLPVPGDHMAGDVTVGGR